MRIHVALDQPLDKPLPTGARATVQLYNSEGPFARTFAGLQIHPGELVALCPLIPGACLYPARQYRLTRRMIFARRVRYRRGRDHCAQHLHLLRRAVAGVFFVVYPLMLMSLVPMFNLHVARQFIFSAAVNCVEMVLIVGYLSQWPVIATPVVFALYVMRFRFMEPGDRCSCWDRWGGVPEHDAQLYELSHQQLGTP